MWKVINENDLTQILKLENIASGNRAKKTV